MSHIPSIVNLDSSCSGCGVCLAVCPKSALSFKESRGFCYPVLDLSLCVGCLLCEKTCPVLACSLNRVENPLSVYWAIANDEKITASASSGGVFPLLAYQTLRNDGAVYGATWSEDYKRVEHVRVVDELKLESIFCSKYVQSNLSNDVFQNIANDLRKGKQVLFSGTGCQIAAIRAYLDVYRIDYNHKLLLVEVICGGVPSPLLWEKWISTKGSVTSVNMRDKSTGWENCSVLYQNDEICEITVNYEDWYMRAFLMGVTQRPSCFDCPSRMSFKSDLLIGDYWRIFFEHPDVNRSRGVSAVLVFTDYGAAAFDGISNEINYGLSSTEKVEHGNHCLLASPVKSALHDSFISDLDSLSIEELINKYPLRESFKKRARRTFGRIVKSIFSNSK